MKFLIDEQLPVGLADWLAARGHDAQHARDAGLKSALDREVRDHALAVGAILVTKDADFSTAIASKGLTVVWLRLGNASNQELYSTFDRAWGDIEHALAEGQSLVEVR